MNLENFPQSESRLTQEERSTITELVASFRQHFAERGTAKSPFLTLRLRFFLQQVILCDRLETTLLSGAGELTPEAAAHLGKAYDRFSRALKSLEDTAKKLTPAAESSPKTSRKTVPPETHPAESPEASRATAAAPTNPVKVQNPTVPPPVSLTRPTGPTSPTPPIQSAIAIERPTPEPVVHLPRPQAILARYNRK